jgi:citrate lyase subunit beta/citryl-CoA lyase
MPGAMSGPPYRTRSWMFVPGNRQHFIDKALGLEVDIVLLDLEDGVPPAEKAAARELVRRALARPSRPVRYVRVNPVPSPWFEQDLARALVPGAEGLCLPKVESSEEVVAAAQRLQELGWADELPILATIESARGLLAAPSIAAAHPQLIGLMLGAEDLALDLGLPTRREREGQDLLVPRSMLVMAAAAARRIAVDGVFPYLNDRDGLVEDAMRARRLGFAGKSTFNPRQVEAINRVFSPTPEELAHARQVVAAFEEADARGDGSVAVGGQLVDQPVVERARRLLQTLDAQRSADR